MTIIDLMSNPYAWLFLSFCTVAAFVFAIYTWVKSKRKKEFTYIKNSQNIIKNGKHIIPELHLMYGNKDIDDLSITKITIWNSGNTIINKSDLVDTKQLKIFSKDNNTKLLDVRIITESDNTNKFKISEIKDRYILIEFDYVNPDDGILVQVIHSGKQSYIGVDCRIKENKKSIIEPPPIEGKESSLIFLSKFYLVFIIISFLWSALSVRIKYSEEGWKQIYIDIISFILAYKYTIFSIFILLMPYFILRFFCFYKKRAHNINPPPNLRD